MISRRSGSSASPTVKAGAAAVFGEGMVVDDGLVYEGDPL